MSGRRERPLSLQGPGSRPPLPRVDGDRQPRRSRPRSVSRAAADRAQGYSVVGRSSSFADSAPHPLINQVPVVGRSSSFAEPPSNRLAGTPISTPTPTGEIRRSYTFQDQTPSHHVAYPLEHDNAFHQPDQKEKEVPHVSGGGTADNRGELNWSAEDMALRRFMSVMAWGPGLAVTKRNRNQGQGRRVLKFDVKHGRLTWSSSLPPYSKTSVDARNLKTVSRQGQVVTVSITHHGVVGFKPARLTDAIVIETGLQAVIHACKTYDPSHKRWLDLKPSRPASIRQTRIQIFH